MDICGIFCALADRMGAPADGIGGHSGGGWVWTGAIERDALRAKGRRYYVDSKKFV